MKHLTFNKLFLVSLFIIFGVLFFSPVLAEDVPEETLEPAPEETPAEEPAPEEPLETPTDEPEVPEEDLIEEPELPMDNPIEEPDDKPEVPAEDPIGEPDNEPTENPTPAAPEEESNLNKEPETTPEPELPADPQPQLLRVQPSLNLMQAEPEELPTLTVYLKLEALGNTLYNDEYTFEACPEDENSATTTLNAWCAISQLAEDQDWDLEYSWGQYGIYLSKINEYDGADYNWWGWYSELEMGMTSLNAHTMTVGENLLLTYGVSPMKIEVDNLQPELNSTTTINLKEFGFDANWNSVWLDSNSSTLVVNGIEIFDEDGIYELEITTTTPYEVYGKKNGFVDTELIVITPQEPEPELETVTINLQIETFDSTIYNDEFVVTECLPTEQSTTTTLTTYCALQQLAESEELDINFNFFGESAFLGNIENYNGSDFNWWAFFHNLDFASEALNEYILNEGNDILLSYGIFPLQVEISTTTPEVNTTTMITVTEFGFDENWAATWLSSPSSTIVVNYEEIFDEDGIYELEITTTTPYQISASKDGFVSTQILTISPTSTTQDNNGNNGGGNSGGGSTGGNDPEPTENVLITEAEIDQVVNKILDYMKSQQNETGMIVEGNMTDWAIMSFGANDTYADDVKQDGGKSLLDYEKTYNLDSSSELNKCAAYPRHILALLAAGVESDDEAITTLRELTLSETCYADNMYGQVGTNDDIFALLGLLSIDENITSQIIIDLVEEIENSQNETNGGFSMGWGIGLDATGASVNALKYAEEKGIEIDNAIYVDAKNYLKENQLEDGGWTWDSSSASSDIMTTSWVLMGINSLGDTQSDWFTETGKNPWYPLVENLTENNYYESAWVPGTPDWFAMKHAVPALKSAFWPIVLDPIVEDFSQGATFTYGGGGSSNVPPVVEEVETPTSTPTTTLNMDIETPTSTPTTLDIEECKDVACYVSTSTENVVTTTPKTQEIPPLDGTPASGGANPPAPVIKKLPVNEYRLPEIEETTSTPEEFTGQVLTSATSTIPTSNTAKNVFGTATAMASGLGLYLGLRFLQTLV